MKIKILLTCLFTIGYALSTTFIASASNGSMNSVHSVSESQELNTNSDIIKLRDGGEIKAVIIEITQSEIKYKRASNPNGPMYTIGKNDVESILYPNGETDVFAQVNLDDESSLQREAKPALDNFELIGLYNREIPTRDNKEMDTKKNKYTTSGFVYWGITENSILSTDDIEVAIINSKLDGFNEKSVINKYRYSYLISIKNKTNRPIYIDLGNTYKVVDGVSYVWYDGTSVTQTKSQNTNPLDLGLFPDLTDIDNFVGGVTGGNTVSVDKSIQRIIAVAPHSTISLPARQRIIDNTIEPIYEWLDATPSKQYKKNFGLRKWETRTYDEQSAPFRFDYYITYSNDQNLNNSYVLPIHLYSRAIYGTPDGEVLRTKNYNLKDTKHIIYGEYR